MGILEMTSCLAFFYLIASAKLRAKPPSTTKRMPIGETSQGQETSQTSQGRTKISVCLHETKGTVLAYFDAKRPLLRA